MARRALVLTFSFFVLLSLFAMPSAIADPGDLDPNWSQDGRQETSFGDLPDGAESIAIQADQKVIAVGSTNARFFGPLSAEAPRSQKGFGASGGNGPSCDWAIVRYREDGVLDNTYGPNGNGKVRFGGPDCDFLRDVAIDAAGNAVVVGQLNQEVSVARYLPTGVLDATFSPAGTPGVATFDFGNNDWATAVVIDPSGRILISGNSETFRSAQGFGSEVTGFVARLEPDGDLDPTFAAAGVPGVYFFEEAFPEPDDTLGEDLVRQPNGSIVAVGALFEDIEQCSQGEPGTCGIFDETEHWLILRLTDAGVLDGTFNPGGSPPGTKVMFEGDFAQANAVALQGNKIVVVGNFVEFFGPAGGSGPRFFAPVVRLTATGQNDQTFANGGVKFIDAGPDGEGLNDVLVQADRKIVVVGTESAFSTEFPEEVDMLVVRLTKDSGAYDSTYHGDGRVTVDFGGFDEANHGALKLDGNLLIAGFAMNESFNDNGGGGDPTNIATARLYGDPKGLDCTISGTPGNDVLSGTAHADVICGAAGNDTLKGFKGNDILRGGLGNDTVEGGLGTDYILGYAGNDRLNAADGAGGDVVEGDSGTDTCATDPGDIIINC